MAGKRKRHISESKRRNYVTACMHLRTLPTFSIYGRKVSTRAIAKIARLSRKDV